MRWREFLGVLSSAAMSSPLMAPQPAMPMIGLLDSRSSDGMASQLRAFHQGLTTAAGIGRAGLRDSRAGYLRGS
jgi:hypothetical protein